MLFTLRNTLFAVFCSFTVFPIIAFAQPTTITYQGFLEQGGQPANGNFAMNFSVFDAQSGGSQIGGTIAVNPVSVSSGSFTVQLDFGGGVFSGPNRFLQITVGGNALSPRPLVTSSAYAVRSISASLADEAVNVTGPLTGADPSARLIVTNTQAGISNPTPANLPPAALRGSTTSATGSTTGLLGISSSQNGNGVIGLASGAGEEPSGVVGIATSPTGQTVGISGQVVSPDGTAVDAEVPLGGKGYLFRGSNGSSFSFFVRANGDIETGGKITAQNGLTVQNGAIVDDGIQIQSGDLSVAGGQTTTRSLNVNGNLSVTNGLTVENGGIVAALGIQIQSGGLSVAGGQTTTRSLFVDGNLGVSGAKNNVVTLSNGKTALLYANESPEYWFEDFGTVELKNGRAEIKIDPTFADAANTTVSYKVFLTPNGDCEGLYVARKAPDSFEVRELGGGRSNISFDYRIVAKRRGYETVRFGPTEPTTK